MKIYLDVCCLNRPFDDHAQDRVRLESEAVMTILNYCKAGIYALVCSPIVDYEVLRIPIKDQRQKVYGFTELRASQAEIDAGVRAHAKQLEKKGFKALDALHIACAESAEADVFLTTDDRLVKRAQKEEIGIQVSVENPLKWLLEIRESEE